MVWKRIASPSPSLMLRVGVALMLLLCVRLLPGQTRAEFEQRRRKLVEEVLAPAGIKDERVLSAMRETPRHEFVPLDLRAKAYFDMGLPIGNQQTISSPLIVSQMTQALKPVATDKVLEIGTGSGYQAAVLSPLVKEVYSIEIVEPLGRKAKQVLDRLGYKNVHTKVGDGYLGWPEHAPFDKIIVTCSPEKVPQPLVDQLADGGLMAIPVGERYSQTLYLFTKKGDKLEKEALLPTLFVPMTGKAEIERQVKPDPANPRLINGSFEEEPEFKADGGQPGWYYERLVTRQSDSTAPDGMHYVEFKNSEPGLDGHLLQGFAADGRQVTRLEVSGWVKTENVAAGLYPDQIPCIAITLYDDQRRQLEPIFIGPFRGTSAWHEERKTFVVPREAREGIFRIGLFGATGTACFDKLEIRKVAR
jgi:protein-L-isoaspartate(D-aspartate) O-methyltransferase